MIYRRNIEESARDTFVITDIQASTIVDKIFGVVPVRCELVSAQEVHGTACGATLIGAIERLQSTETSGNGDQVATGFDLEGTADTTQTGTIVTTSNIHIFEAGDRVGFNGTGTSTSLANMIIVCQFRPVDDLYLA